MMDKSRPGYGRSRTTPRGTHRVSTIVGSAAHLAAARRVAETLVAARVPQLAGRNPSVSVGKPVAPNAALLARLGLGVGELADQTASQYTFTFSGTCTTADGAETPVAAAITVDERLQIVKMSVTH